MPVNRFEELKIFSHFSDNTHANMNDKVTKTLNERLQCIPTEEPLAVDEEIVPFKGRHSMKQYNPREPHK